MLIVWFILGWIVLETAVLGALWVIGWSYQLGVKAGRKQLLNEVTAAVQTPEFAASVAQAAVTSDRAREAREPLRRSPPIPLQ